jgi:hypothetical protein
VARKRGLERRHCVGIRPGATRRRRHGIDPDPGPAGHPCVPGNRAPRDGSDKAHHRSLPPQPTR